MKLKYVFRNISVPLTEEQFEEMKAYVEEHHLKRGAWVAGLMLDAMSAKQGKGQQEGAK